MTIIIIKFNSYKFLGGNAMNNISTIRIILHISFSLLFCCNIYTQENGYTEVTKWKDNKEAAFCLNFDDSNTSQLDNAVPNLEARGLTGTFYVNPGKSRHQDHNAEWLGILNRGQHLAPHTMNHIGATSYEMAYYEIGASAEYCWDAYGVPYHSELFAYASGGGVTWTGLTREERLWIDDHFNLINRYHNNPSEPHWHSARMPYSKAGRSPLSDLIEHFNDNWAENEWEMILYHGVGGTSSVNLEEFILLLDYLESKKDVVWIAPYIDVFKYDMERFSADVEVLQNTDEIIKLRLSSDIAASGFITNDVNLYNEPLTLITQVPWPEVTVTQGSSVKTYTANNGEVMYEALPNVGTTNRGDIILQQSDGLPVELTSFSASVKNSEVTLNWETATEVSNYGFEILRRVYPAVGGTLDNEWVTIGFVEGHGNSNSPKYYNFSDTDIGQSGKYYYRLKQIDNDGTFEYSDVVSVTISAPVLYSLSQNYPNPFNPETRIDYTLKEQQNVSLRVYNMLGEMVQELLNEIKPPRSYSVTFNAFNLPSGIYIYRIQTESFTVNKKMTFLK